jgi:hypothetical protein
MGRVQQTPIRRTKAVLAYLARYTHRVAISNRRLISFDAKASPSKTAIEGRERYKIMTLATDELIRRSHPRAARRLFPASATTACSRTAWADNIARARGCSCAGSPNTTADANAGNADEPPTLASLPVLRRPHDHHRDVRTGLNPAPPSERAYAGNQDRHIMSLLQKSSSRTAGHVRCCRSVRHTSARANITLLRQIHASIFMPRSAKRPSQRIERAHHFQQPSQSSSHFPTSA